MTKVVRMPDGWVTLCESKAQCPHCKRNIPFDEIDEKFMKQSNHTIRFKCKCKRFIGITQDIKGDFVAYKLKPEDI
jgi:hypothetical protein